MLQREGRGPYMDIQGRRYAYTSAIRRSNYSDAGISAEEFSTLCIVRADLSPLKGSALPQTSASGKTFWKIIFSVEIHFGLTEFRARIKWVDNGEIK